MELQVLYINLDTLGGLHRTTMDVARVPVIGDQVVLGGELFHVIKRRWTAGECILFMREVEDAK